MMEKRVTIGKQPALCRKAPPPPDCRLCRLRAKQGRLAMAGGVVKGCMHKQHWDVTKQSCSTGLRDIHLQMAQLSYMNMAHLSCTAGLTCAPHFGQWCSPSAPNPVQ